MESPSKSLLELLNHPLSFGQLSLLSSSQFSTKCEERGIRVDRSLLERLHEAGLIAPIYVYDPKATPASGLTRPHQISFHLASELAGLGSSKTREVYYSPYQTLALPELRIWIDRMRWQPHLPADQFGTRTEDSDRNAYLQQKLDEIEHLVVALSILETAYRSDVMMGGRITRGRTVAQWEELRRNFDPVDALNWLGCDPAWIRKVAERLLLTTHHLDPTKRWRHLIRFMRPVKWEELRGDALLGMDRLIAAEILLLFYDDLVRCDVAPAVEKGTRKFPATVEERIGTRAGDLDAVLMDYGLSPDPSLVLVCEGQTEGLILSRAMAVLGMPRQRRFIELFEAQSITKDFGLLAAYISKPQLGELVDTYVVLNRPVTQYLVVVDPEHVYKTTNDREKARASWVQQIEERLPRGCYALAI